MTIFSYLPKFKSINNTNMSLTLSLGFFLIQLISYSLKIRYSPGKPHAWVFIQEKSYSVFFRGLLWIFSTGLVIGLNKIRNAPYIYIVVPPSMNCWTFFNFLRIILRISHHGCILSLIMQQLFIIWIFKGFPQQVF